MYVPIINQFYHVRLSCLPLCSSDVAVPHPDKKSVIMYVTSLFQVLPQTVSMEAIKEVETLPRATTASITRVTTEEHYKIQTQQRFSQQVRNAHIQLFCPFLALSAVPLCRQCCFTATSAMLLCFLAPVKPRDTVMVLRFAFSLKDI